MPLYEMEPACIKIQGVFFLNQKKKKQVEFMITYKGKSNPTNCENASYLKNNKHLNPTKQKNVTP